MHPFGRAEESWEGEVGWKSVWVTHFEFDSVLLHQTAKNTDKHSHTQISLFWFLCLTNTANTSTDTHLEWSATQAWAGANRRRCCLFQALLTRIADAPNHDKKHQKLRVSKGVAAAAAVCGRSCCVAGCLSSLTSPPKHLAREGRDSHPSCVGLRFAVSHHSGFSGNNRKAKCSEPQSEAILLLYWCLQL